jgi:hypothetical protein
VRSKAGGPRETVFLVPCPNPSSCGMGPFFLSDGATRPAVVEAHEHRALVTQPRRVPKTSLIDRRELRDARIAM